MRRYDSATWPSASSLPQDGASRGSGDIGHMCEVFVVHVDFNRAAVSRVGDATIPSAEQDRHKSLNVVAYHQVIGSAHDNIEMINRYETKESPRSRITPDDFVNCPQRQMQQFGVPSSG